MRVRAFASAVFDRVDAEIARHTASRPGSGEGGIVTGALSACLSRGRKTSGETRLLDGGNTRAVQRATDQRIIGRSEKRTMPRRVYRSTRKGNRSGDELLEAPKLGPSRRRRLSQAFWMKAVKTEVVRARNAGPRLARPGCQPSSRLRENEACVTRGDVTNRRRGDVSEKRARARDTPVELS